MSKRKLKEYMTSNGKNTTAQVAQLSIWRDGQGISGISIQSNSLKTKCNQCTLDRFHAVSIELNSEF